MRRRALLRRKALVEMARDGVPLSRRKYHGCMSEFSSRRFLRGGSLYIWPGILDTTRQRRKPLQTGTMNVHSGAERSLRIPHPFRLRLPTSLLPIHQPNPASPLSILSKAPRTLALSFSSSLAQPFLHSWPVHLLYPSLILSEGLFRLLHRRWNARFQISHDKARLQQSFAFPSLCSWTEPHPFGLS